MRAIADYYEALMHARRGREGDATQVTSLLDAALAKCREIGMTGWVRRADDLRQLLQDKPGASI